jgi:hypothetical protein
MRPAHSPLCGPRTNWQLEVAATPSKLRKRGKGMVAVPDAKLPPLSADQVRGTLERVRR